MATTLSEHVCTTTKTNTNGIVPLCSCGWIGSVHPAPRYQLGTTKRYKRAYEEATERAEAEHRKHVQLDPPLRGTLTAENFVGTVLNTRRFGHA